MSFLMKPSDKIWVSGLFAYYANFWRVVSFDINLWDTHVKGTHFNYFSVYLHIFGWVLVDLEIYNPSHSLEEEE